jgi:hypothetical protein
MRKGDYQSAQEAFAGLGDFEDSADQAQFCANTLAYNAAEALMEAGDYQAAADAFLELGSFQDASEQAQFCENTLLYSEAEALFEQGEYEAAQPLYEQLLDADFSDAADKYDYCVNMEAYIEALTLLELEQYYDAYCALEELNGFLDSYSDMADCIQPFRRRAKPIITTHTLPGPARLPSTRRRATEAATISKSMRKTATWSAASPSAKVKARRFGCRREATRSKPPTVTANGSAKPICLETTDTITSLKTAPTTASIHSEVEIRIYAFATDGLDRRRQRGHRKRRQGVFLKMKRAIRFS